MTTNLAENSFVTWRRLFSMGICVSLIVHTAALVALATWSLDRSRVRFAGRDHAVQLIAVSDEPFWNPRPADVHDFQSDAPVVIEPATAQIAQRRFVHAPTAVPVPTAADVPLHLERAIEPRVPPRAESTNTAQRSPNVGTKKDPVPEFTKKTDTPHEMLLSEPPAVIGNTDETPPDLSQNAPPNYPTLAISRRWQGTVLLRVSIDATGAVTDVEVVRSSGHEILDGAAAGAVRRWKAAPARRGGRPVATVEILPVRFKL